jgi:hypothetical protein
LRLPPNPSKDGYMLVMKKQVQENKHGCWLEVPSTTTLYVLVILMIYLRPRYTSMYNCCTYLQVIALNIRSWTILVPELPNLAYFWV